MRGDRTSPNPAVLAIIGYNNGGRPGEYLSKRLRGTNRVLELCDNEQRNGGNPSVPGSAVAPVVAPQLPHL